MLQQIYLNQGRYRVLHANYDGQGTFGGVYRATFNGQVFAVKEIKETIGAEGIYGSVIRQKVILKQLVHNNIIRLTEQFFQNQKAYLVFPYFNLNLRQMMRDHYQNNVSGYIIKKIMEQLLSALKAAHNARIIHRDVKPQNIMIANNDPKHFTLKLADWGSSRKMNVGNNQNLTVQVIPIAYRPPELCFGSKKYTETVDIWSVGCIFYELLMGGQRPFQAYSPNQKIFEMINKVGLSEKEDEKWVIEAYNKLGFQILQEDIVNLKSINLDAPFIAKFGKVTQACDLLKKMLRINPQKRLSASDCLKHPFFDTTIGEEV